MSLHNQMQYKIGLWVIPPCLEKSRGQAGGWGVVNGNVRRTVRADYVESDMWTWGNGFPDPFLAARARKPAPTMMFF